MRAFDDDHQPEPKGPAIDATASANDDPGSRPKVEPYRLGGSLVDREVTKLKDEGRRLRTSLENCHRDQLGEHEVRRMLGVRSQAPDEPPTWIARRPHEDAARTPETAMTMWADWHLEEVVSRE